METNSPQSFQPAPKTSRRQGKPVNPFIPTASWRRIGCGEGSKIPLGNFGQNKKPGSEMSISTSSSHDVARKMVPTVDLQDQDQHFHSPRVSLF